ncbi:hypothetical protein F5146DRAFT_1143279 [Armillaria mellea]|nr:hypothetical protein F5146DRAFT_1143279 [Armillaria mellea]
MNSRFDCRRRQFHIPWILHFRLALNISRGQSNPESFTTEEGSRQPVFDAVESVNDKDVLRGVYISLPEVVQESHIDDGNIIQDKGWDEVMAI